MSSARLADDADDDEELLDVAMRAEVPMGACCGSESCLGTDSEVVVSGT